MSKLLYIPVAIAILSCSACAHHPRNPGASGVLGAHTASADWTPLAGRPGLFPEEIDKRDPWQFKNVLVR